MLKASKEKRIKNIAALSKYSNIQTRAVIDMIAPTLRILGQGRRGVIDS